MDGLGGGAAPAHREKLGPDREASADLSGGQLAVSEFPIGQALPRLTARGGRPSRITTLHSWMVPVPITYLGIGAETGVNERISLRSLLETCPHRTSLHLRLRSMLQKNPEEESVRNQQQRHDESRNKEGGSQLPRQQSGVRALVEGVEQIG